MSDSTIIRVPDIGDFKDVAVVEVLLTEGASVARDASILVLETDKATMEVPASAGGLVREVLVKVGDRVSAGSPIARLAEEGEARTGAALASDAPAADGTVQAPVAPSRDAAAPAAASADMHCGLLVLGGGPGGYSAAFRAADLGLDVILVERFERLGGVCLNVGCIPSKALLHLTGIMDEAKMAARHGMTFGEPVVDLAKVREWKDSVVGELTNGLAGMARARKVRVVTGTGRFAGPNLLEVEAAGGIRRIGFERCIIAAGSRPMRLPFLPEDPRIVDSTGALALASVPQRMLVIGGGIVGLEMATVYATLGAAVDIVERLDTLMPGVDRDLVNAWSAANRERFGRIMTGTRLTAIEAKPDGLHARFEGREPVADGRYDLVLQAAGRIANGDRLALDRAGLTAAKDGTIAVDRQMRTSAPHIFAIGDIAGPPMLAHKAVHEGHVAAEAAAGLASAFDTTVIPSVAYTRPEIAWVGLTETVAKAAGSKPAVSRFPWAASGRALASDARAGATKLLFDEASGRIGGGGIVGAHAGELIAEIALAIEMGADAHDIGKTIHPHPTLSETVGMAAEVSEGVCTDLPPARRPAAAPGRTAAE